MPKDIKKNMYKRNEKIGKNIREIETIKRIKWRFCNSIVQGNFLQCWKCFISLLPNIVALDTYGHLSAYNVASETKELNFQCIPFQLI